MTHRSLARLVAAALAAIVGVASPALAFNCHKNTLGPLTITVGDPGVVDTIDRVYDVAVTLENAGDTPLAVMVTASVIDTCRVVGEASRAVTLAPRASREVTFQIAAGAGTYSAHYPVRVDAAFTLDGAAVRTAAVRVFETRFPPVADAAASDRMTMTTVPSHGGVLLSALANHQIAWAYYDRPLERLPIGWQGSEPTSRASFHRGGRIDRGAIRAALTMHPPYAPTGGSVVAEYGLALPEEGPITLSFFHAIRDHGENEPASDGVTFRVWVRPVDDASAALGQMLFERHTDSKVWLPGEVDLSPYAGRTIVLGLESHPGPRRNTVCDSCYWGDPVVFSGEKPRVVTEDEHKTLRALAEQGARGVAVASASLYSFALGDDGGAGVALGPNGLLDGVLAFRRGPNVVRHDGLNVSIEGSRVGQWPSMLVTERVDVHKEDARLRVTHHLRFGDERFPLTIEAWADAPGLRVRVDCPRNISDISLGSADRHASRVYFGHGYCITEPGAFQVGGGGHSLSTSHVGFEFEDGPALLMATDTPPDSLRVDPDRRVYTLHVHPRATLTFVPADTAFEAAIAYRPLYDKKPAPGFSKKAGRFVFDIWGRDFQPETDLLRQAFAYGVTDAMVIKHVWQRWGYDVRLPDIWPPRPEWGGLKDLQEMAELCKEHGVLFGLHDNYIDFYPDAEGFSYDHITFNENGQPRKAWINTGVDAQSYQWRPDRFRPFLERNLALMKPSIDQTTYFVDVFTSANVYDYYDRDGNFHSLLETRDRWGECFDIIRESLGDNAPMTSEAGADFLIGWLEGADCQFLQISDEPREFNLRIPCASWSRVPWFDAVNHTRFSLHGVGYSGRYQGGRSRALHGIESDDYISAEILTGHALMVDRESMLRGAARKYWLAHHIIREIAEDEIESVRYVEGNPDLLEVVWKSGVLVLVNRGEKDHEFRGVGVVPPFGFVAGSRHGGAAIERRDGVVVERAGNTDGTWYVNGRGCLPNAPLNIMPEADRVEYLGGRRFQLIVDWKAGQPAPKDLSVFYHIFKPRVSRLKIEGWYAGGGDPGTPTSQWSGVVRTGEGWTMTVPEDVAPGEYDVLVGLFDSRGNGRRYPLLGNDDGQTRFILGKLMIDGDGREVTGVRFTKMPYVEPLAERLVVNTRPIDFGVAITTGGMRIESKVDRIVVTPLPLETACEVTLRLDVAGHAGKRVTALEAVDMAGKKLRDVPFQPSGGNIAFRTKEGEFAYHVRVTER